MAYYLQTHPLIVNINQYDPDTKEGHWFDSRAVETMDTNRTIWYLNRFDGRRIIRDVVLKQPGFSDIFEDPNKEIDGFATDKESSIPSKLLDTRPLVMDYTPNYFMNDETPLLIQRTFPKTYKKLKFILCIRNPTKRTLSSWRSKKDKHGEMVPSLRSVVDLGIAQSHCIEECFAKYFSLKDPSTMKFSHKMRLNLGGNRGGPGHEEFKKTEEEEFDFSNRCAMKLCRREHDTSQMGQSGAIGTMAHVAKSLYVYQLINWLNVYDFEQFCIVTLEDYVARPLATLQKILDFLGLPMLHNATAEAMIPHEFFADANILGESFLEDRFKALASTGSSDGFSVREKLKALKNEVRFANNMAKKRHDKHKDLKEAQHAEQKQGWDSIEQLIVILRKVKNKTKPNPSLDSQIIDSIVNELKLNFLLSVQRLEKILGIKMPYMY